jgi:sulfur-oxidizing protein SoxA
MKKFILVFLLAFSLPALAEIVKTAGALETSPEATLSSIQKYYATEIPNVKGDAFVDGALNFSTGAMEYYQSWMSRMSDSFDQPEEYTKLMANGKKIWETPFPNGKTYASCFPNGGKGAAANYPKLDAYKIVVTFERALNECSEANGGKKYEYTDNANLGGLSIYARKLSDGARINVKVETAAEKRAFESGKAIFYGRAGKGEQACAHCHIQQAGKTARTEQLSPVIGQAAHWPLFRANKATGDLEISTLQQRYFGCQKNTQVADPIKQGSVESNELEYFHTYLSNGMPLKTGVFRK